MWRARGTGDGAAQFLAYSKILPCLTLPNVAAANPFTELLARYRTNPVLMVRELFHVEPDLWQIELLEAYATRFRVQYDAQGIVVPGTEPIRRISVRSGHGVGKTAVLAWIVNHHLLTAYPQRTVCTAPTSAQLYDALASEIKGWLGKLEPALRDLFFVTTDHITLLASPNESFVSFRTSRPEMPEALAGVHADNVLLIADEASGIPESVFESAAGSMSGHHATTILAGNPVRSSGLFYDSHHEQRDKWYTIKVSCEGNGRCAVDFVSSMLAQYGERSNAYRVRVLGEFPAADDDTVIPFELMETALRRDVQPLTVGTIWGVDCARFGNDRSALAKRKGNVLLEAVRSWRMLDTMELTGRVKAEWDTTPIDQRPEEICVDAIGLGAGVADRLRELGLPARAINVSESPSLGELYMNLRAELWFKAREWLAARDCHLCGDEALGKELIGPRYKITSNGKRQVESKADIKKRGSKESPDLADAFILTLAAEATTALGQIKQSWRTPLKRNIKGVV